MSDLIGIIENLDNPTAISYADQVAKQMIKDSNFSYAISNQTNFAKILSEAFPIYSESIISVESIDSEIRGKISRNFLKTIAVEGKYSIIVKNAIENPKKFDPVTLMFLAAAVTFILQTEFDASYKDGKLEIHAHKKATSEELIKKIFTIRESKS